MSARKHIVAGVDGGPDGLRATEYAAKLAVSEGRPIRLVHAYHMTPMAGPMVPPVSLGEIRNAGARALADAERLLADIAPGLEADSRLVPGSPAGALVEASKSAAVVVVGRSAAHGIGRFLSGSTSTAVAAKARVPVVSVSGSWSPEHDQDRVVIGADGSPQGRDALAFAFAEASRRNAALMAVRVFETTPRWTFDVAHIEDEGAAWFEDAELALAEDLAGWCEKYPDVPVFRVVERSPSAAEMLVNRSDGASLLVIGARGHGGLLGLDMGLTALNVLAHAHAPVAVVHRGEGDIEASERLVPTSVDA
jgi:nucleotide-binding universal stress UspA family protein